MILEGMLILGLLREGVSEGLVMLIILVLVTIILFLTITPVTGCRELV